MNDPKVKIPISGLKEGDHFFDFNIENSFFNLFEYSEIKKGKAGITINMKKRSQLIELEILINGHVEVECDLCLEMFDMPFKYSGPIYVKYEGAQNEQDDKILFVKENETEIDLTHYVYESICLSIPYKKIHKNKPDGTSGCNKAMLERLNIHKVKHENINTDPRWDRLKDLINK